MNGQSGVLFMSCVCLDMHLIAKNDVCIKIRNDNYVRLPNNHIFKNLIEKYLFFFVSNNKIRII